MKNILLLLVALPLTAICQKVVIPISDSNLTNDWIIKISEGGNIKDIANSIDADDYIPIPIGTLKGYYLLRYTSKSINSKNIEKSIKSNISINWSQRGRILDLVKKNVNDSLLSDQWHLNNTGQNGGHLA